MKKKLGDYTLNEAKEICSNAYACDDDCIFWDKDSKHCVLEAIYPECWEIENAE